MKMEVEAFIPVSIELDWPTKDAIIECIREQNSRYGFKRFLLAAPGAGHRSKNYPDKSLFSDLARLYNEVKEAFEGTDITFGWWHTLTIKSGSSIEFSPIIRSDGQPHPFANCPLDEGFIRKFCENIAEFVRIADPSLIIFEDDYSINAAAGGYGCFCERHLSEFSGREGKVYKREKLLEIFKERTPDALNLHKRYRALTRDSLVRLSEAVRTAVDEFNPDIPIGLMQPGSADIDGDTTEAICRALAGKKHTPFSRIYGAYYCGGELKGIPTRLYHAIYSREHIYGDFKFYHESDTFPHTRFFSSAKQMKAFMAIAYSSGFIGSLFQTQQLLDDPNEEGAYGEMFASERKRFSELISTVKECQRVGASLPYDPFYNTFDSGNPRDPYWSRALDLFGIPYTTKEASVAFIDERQARYSSDEQIKKYLSGGLFLDGDAALILCERGYGKYIGVSVGDDVARDKIVYDLGAREVIKPPFDTVSKGKNMPIAHMFCAGGNGILRELTVIDPKVEIISEAFTFEKRFLSVAMTRFENELGGRIAVMGMTLKNNRSQSLFNYRRMKLLDELLLWCGAKLPFVKREPCVHIVYNKANEGEGFSSLLTLINLGDDTVNSLPVYLPPEMRGKRILSLNVLGEWETADISENDDGIIINSQLSLCEPIYLKFE